MLRFYINDRSAKQGQRNVSVHFQNNSDLFNKSIYATTLLPCVWGNLSRKAKVNSTPLGSLFNQTFHFVTSSGSTSTIKDII